MFFEVICLAAAAAQGAAVGELIPREVLFGNPERSSVSISPDGTMLAFRGPVDGVMNAWVQPVEGGEAKALTNFSDRPIGGLSWSWNGEQLLFSKDAGGDENFHVYVVDIDGGEPRDLTPHDGVRAGVAAFSCQAPCACDAGDGGVGRGAGRLRAVTTRRHGPHHRGAALMSPETPAPRDSRPPRSGRA